MRFTALAIAAPAFIETINAATTYVLILIGLNTVNNSALEMLSPFAFYQGFVLHLFLSYLLV